MADKALLQEIAQYLRETEEFLKDCDDNLAWEVAAKEGIGGRIYRSIDEVAALRKTAENLAQQKL